MNLNDYQKQAMKTDILGKGPKVKVTDSAYIAKVLGLVGEAGEVAEKYKKIIRDKAGVVSVEDKEQLKKELGDVLWYIAALSHYLGLPLEEVATTNIEKLSSRQQRGTLSGKGDER